MNIRSLKSRWRFVYLSSVLLLWTPTWLYQGCTSVRRGVVDARNTPDEQQARKNVGVDTIVIRGINVSAIDSLYVLLADTSARVVSVRVVSSNELRPFGEITVFESNNVIDSSHRSYGLFRARGPIAFVRPETASVDVEVVTSRETSGALQLGINDASAAQVFGGPQTTDILQPYLSTSCCDSCSTVIPHGCSVRTQVYPVRTRRAPPVRTINSGPFAHDTMMTVIWNCLRDDGSHAVSGKYRVQLTPACGKSRGGRMIVWTVQVP